ncbi:MAG: hypothetical protein ACW98Y_04995 [Candidatus Thorarchaeota archaeon]|jgi:hypothetical protein
MSGDSFEETDHYESRSYDTPSTQIEDQLKSRQKKGCTVGCILMMTPIILIIVIFYIQFSPIAFIIPALFIGMFVSIMLGLAILVLYGVGSGGMLRAYEKLKVLGPPDPVLGKRYVLVEYNDVYIIASTWSNFLHFVAFKDKAGVMASSKMKLPKFFGKWQDRVEVDGVKLYRREDTYSVPTVRGDFVSGEAVMYAEAYMPSKYNWVVPEFTKEELIAISKRVTEDAMGSTLE